MQETLFDFTSAEYSQTTGTIKQLLEELNREHKRQPHELLTAKNLKPITNLLTKLSGIPFTSINEEHPIRDIKAIKTLYKTNSRVKGQLINYLEPPKSNRYRIDEILLQQQEQGDFYLQVVQIKNELLLEATLPEQLSSGQELENMLNFYIEIMDKKFFDELINLTVPFQSDISYELDHATIEHYKKLTEKAKTDKNKDASAFDALLIHILGFTRKHRLHFQTAQENQPFIKKPNPIENFEIDNLLLKINQDQKQSIDPYKLITDNKDAVKFFKKYSNELSKITSQLTNHPIKPKQTEKDLELAQKVLKCVYFTDIDSNGEIVERHITINDMICALCAVNHQRLHKTKVERQTHRTELKLTAPQKIIKKLLNSDDVDIPSTVHYIFDKTFWMYISLINNTAKHRKILDELETELKRFHLEILGFKNIEIAINSLFDYERDTRQFFHRFFSDHNITEKQIDIYRNTHPGIITVD